ncbi:glucose 1-dehydrogenase [uncultured Sulfitobacter sp.]|uniref:glucose 1-dehydrogenase n=1 Tax=uncultured Sulfitobacter sp. TaxID=191468 RepID=UPI0026039E10|nr:glucose 1-dehydrogenase [uncultured Sulfitobacter sp.]
MGLVDGLTVVITGAGAGIGRATALCFAAEGAQVVVSDINSNHGAETVTMIEKVGGTAVLVPADVSKPDDVAALFDQAVATYGKIDCAVNNAGIEGKIAPFADQTDDNFDAIISVNLKGTFLCMKAEIAAMLKSGGGTIVNLSSVAGLIGFAGLSPYVASKHGVAGLTKNAALEYGKSGIRVNAVCPGGIDTRMLDSLADQATGGAQSSAEMMDPLHPIGRIGTPQEVAELIVWLCSARASFVTGAVIPVDGGFVAQ